MIPYDVACNSRQAHRVIQRTLNPRLMSEDTL